MLNGPGESIGACMDDTNDQSRSLDRSELQTQQVGAYGESERPHSFLRFSDVNVRLTDVNAGSPYQESVVIEIEHSGNKSLLEDTVSRYLSDLRRVEGSHEDIAKMIHADLKHVLETEKVFVQVDGNKRSWVGQA